MTKATKDKLDPRIILIILFLGITEFDIFNIGQLLISITGRDAWLSVIIGSIIVSISTYLLTRLALRFPRENYWQFNKKIWGKPLTIIIALGYFVFWGFFLTILFKNTSEINKMFFLPKTPLIVPLILIALAGVWLISYGFTALVQFFQATFLFLIIPVIITFFLSFIEIKIDNFFPLFQEGFLPVLKGTLVYLAFFQGLGILLFLVPFLSTTKNMPKLALIGINGVNLFALIQVILSIGILGVNNAERLFMTSASLLQLIEVPGLPAERFELLLALPWFIAIFTTLSLFLYLLSYGLIQIFGFKKRKLIIYVVTFSTCLATYLIPNSAWTIQLTNNVINPGTLIFVYIIPTFTLLLAVLRKVG